MHAIGLTISNRSLIIQMYNIPPTSYDVNRIFQYEQNLPRPDLCARRHEVRWKWSWFLPGKHNGRVPQNGWEACLGIVYQRKWQLIEWIYLVIRQKSKSNISHMNLHLIKHASMHRIMATTKVIFHASYKQYWTYTWLHVLNKRNSIQVALKQVHFLKSYLPVLDHL